MTLTIIDPLPAIRQILLADTTVAALTDGRVYGDELNRGENADMPRAAIVIADAGGGALGGAYQRYGDTRIDLVCYGPTRREARLLYLAAKAVLKQLTRTVSVECVLHWARESAGGHTGIDPDTQWPACLSVWQVLASEQTVT